MTTHDFEERGEATVAFERRLTTVVLDGYAAGAAVDGTWEISSGPACVPDWTVEITRHDPAAPDPERSILRDERASDD